MRKFILFGFALTIATMALAQSPVPDKTVVLTFDDSVKSHLTNVAPLLTENGFSATFFITHLWMDDTDNFMSWEDVAELHKMGFEIGNHSWTHPAFNSPRLAKRMAGELALVENELAKVGVPKPISFAWTGNAFGPESLAVLRDAGYTFARRGMQPEIEYGRIEPGPLYDPHKHDSLMIPSAGDAYPEWTLKDFKSVVDRAKDGLIAVVQFHGVPDISHPWVHTEISLFRECMRYLKDEQFNVIAMRDLAAWLPEKAPDDPMTVTRHPSVDPDDEKFLSAETNASRADSDFWLYNMLYDHRYSDEEAAQVMSWSVEDLTRWKVSHPQKTIRSGKTLRVRPYPGGRHPRIGFLDGAIDPQRGTKASIFTPWDNNSYVVIDLPEAIWESGSLMYLAHTHIPTIWDQQNIYLENIDWTRSNTGELSFSRILPNQVSFGASIRPAEGRVEMSLWLHNGSDRKLEGLRAQICLMLKGADGFDRQNQDGKIYEIPSAAVCSDSGDKWIIIAFEDGERSWGSAACPCIHADPKFPDCEPGERVAIRGVVSFHQGRDIDVALAGLRELLAP